MNLRSPNGEWDCGLLDISLKGALVERPAGWNARIDEAAELELRLTDNEAGIGMQGQRHILRKTGPALPVTISTLIVPRISDA